MYQDNSERALEAVSDWAYYSWVSNLCDFVFKLSSIVNKLQDNFY